MLCFPALAAFFHQARVLGRMVSGREGLQGPCRGRWGVGPRGKLLEARAAVCRGGECWRAGP